MILLRPFKRLGSSFLLPFPVLVFILFLAALVFNWRAVSSICMGVLFIAGLSNFNKQTGTFKASPFFYLSIGCILFFISKIFTLYDTSDTGETLAHLRKSLPLALAPFCFYANSQLFRLHSKQIMQVCTIMVLTALLYCLLIACARYFSGSDFRVFFYHEFSSALAHHAVQLSVIVFMILLWLNEKETGFPKKIQNGCSLLLAGFLVLLSSKMILVFVAVYAFYTLRKKPGKSFSPALLFPAMMMVILLLGLTRNPVSNRFRDVFSGNSRLFLSQGFHQGIYFNGMQFRLVQYRFTWELLDENRSWLSGLSPGDAQKKLDQKYISTGMYTGRDNQTGYLGYHTHNQFLQTILQQGLAGLTFFIFLLLQLLGIFWNRKSFTSKLVGLLLLAWCCSDAVLETQYGIALFLSIPLLAWMYLPGTNYKIIPGKAVDANSGGNPIPA